MPRDRELSSAAMPRATEIAGGGGPVSEAASRALAENAVWYHTIELAPGVVTPGRVDLRRVAARVLPDDLSGRRALDVGTFDGFWAFEMERRGAQVVAIDVDTLEAAEWPPIHRATLERRARDWDIELGRGFRLAADALESSVERVICPVYELDPERIGGPVDFAFSGAILLHLRDPVRALERIAASLVPGGELRTMEPISLRMTLRSPRRPAGHFQAAQSEFNWWLPNTAGLAAWMRAAGFTAVRRLRLIRPPATERMRQLHAVHRAETPKARR